MFSHPNPRAGGVAGGGMESENPVLSPFPHLSTVAPPWGGQVSSGGALTQNMEVDNGAVDDNRYMGWL